MSISFFRIRAPLREAFRGAAHESFLRRMAVHLGVYFRDEVAPLSSAELRAIVETGIIKAARHGIVSERGVCRYIDVMFAFGADFDRDPALTWVTTILADRHLRTPDGLARRLHLEAVERRSEATGLSGGKRHA